MDPNDQKSQEYQGSCHCGAVRFAVELDLAAGGARCNCSICAKIAQTAVIVKPGAFKLLTEESALSSYEWGGRTARRFFCSTCGIHCFGRGHLPQVGGDYVSVNLNSLDGVELADLKVIYWDGRHNNWQAGTRETPWPILSTV